MPEMAEKLEVGAVYRVEPRYSFRRTLVVKLLEVVHEWTDDEGTEQVALWGRRVRPAELNVTFGNDHGFVVRRDQLKLLVTAEGDDLTTEAGRHRFSERVPARFQVG